MLCLSRKQNERIVINGNIKVTVLKVRGDKVTLGIEAPEDVKVLREELVLKGGDDGEKDGGESEAA